MAGSAVGLCSLKPAPLERSDLSHALPPVGAGVAVDVVADELAFEARLPARMPAIIVPTRARMRLTISHSPLRATLKILKCALAAPMPAVVARQTPFRRLPCLLALALLGCALGVEPRSFVPVPDRLAVPALRRSAPEIGPTLVFAVVPVRTIETRAVADVALILGREMQTL